MISSYHIDEANGLIVVKMIGPITVADQIAFVDKVVADPKYQKGMNSISDLTEAVFDWGLAEIDQFRSYVYSISENIGPCKWALISRGGITLISAKLFIVLHNIRFERVKIKLFSGKFDAIKWLENRD